MNYLWGGLDGVGIWTGTVEHTRVILGKDMCYMSQLLTSLSYWTSLPAVRFLPRGLLKISIIKNDGTNWLGIIRRIAVVCESFQC